MSDDELLERRTTAGIIGAFYEVYNRLSFGFLEHVYSLALERELVERGHSVAREVIVTIYYKGKALTRQGLDMLVDDKVVVENKSTCVLPTSTRTQILNYLKASTLEVGLILHSHPAQLVARLPRSLDQAWTQSAPFA